MSWNAYDSAGRLKEATTQTAVGDGVLLYDQTLVADTASIDTGAVIPGGYAVLEVYILVRTDRTGIGGASDNVDLTFNNDTGALYELQNVQGGAATAAASRATAQTKTTLNAHSSDGVAGFASATVITIPGYADTTFFKTYTILGGQNDTTTGDNFADYRYCTYRSTSAINRIKIAAESSGKLKAGSRMIIIGRGGSSMPNTLPPLTTLPGNPLHGQPALLSVDPTNGVNWLFVYNASSGSSSKWEFAGGPPLYAEVTTDESTTSATYVALTTAGPSIALTRAGDYMVSIGADIYPSVTANGAAAVMSYDIGGTGADDADGVLGGMVTANNDASLMRVRPKTGIAASTTLTSKYRRTAGTAHFKNRWMSVLPVRVA